MPKYRVETDQGNFIVELDKAPASQQELNSLVQESLAGAPSTATATTTTPTTTGQPQGFEEKLFEEKLKGPLAIGLPVAGSLGGATVGGMLGGPAGVPIGESIGSGIGEGVAQATGISDPSMTQLLLAVGAGPVARGVLGTTKGVARGAGSLMMPQQFRVAGTELTEQIFRAPNSRALFEIARRSGTVPTRRLVGVLDDAIKAEKSLSTSNPKAIKVLSNFKNKLAGVKEPARSVQTGVVDASGKQVVRQVPSTIKGGLKEIDYGDLIDEVQRLNLQASKAFSAGDNVAGSRLSETAKLMLDEMDKISPAIKAANAAYRRGQNVIKLADVIGKGNPTGELRKLMRHDPLFGEGFTKQEFRVMEDIVDRLGRFPGQALGLGRAAVQAVFEPVAEMLANPAGRAFLRNTVLKGPGKPAALWAATIQAARAFQAQQNQQQQGTFLQQSRLNQQLEGRPSLTR